MPDFVIRKAAFNDAEKIHIIETQCFSDPWSVASILDDISKNERAYYLVASKDNEVLGYVGVWKILDEGHITNVAVAPAYRRGHVGSQLIEALIKDLEEQGITKITLEVRRSNEAALALYEKMGFEAIGVRKGYYENNGEDAIIMWRGWDELEY